MAHGSYRSQSALALGVGDHRSKTLGIASCCRPSLKRSSFVDVAKGRTHRRRLSRVPAVFDEEVTDSALLCLSPSKSSWQWGDSLFFLAGPLCPTGQECQTSFSFLLISCQDCQQHSKTGLPKHFVIGRSFGLVIVMDTAIGHLPFPSPPIFPPVTTRQTPTRNRKSFVCPATGGSFPGPELGPDALGPASYHGVVPLYSNIHHFHINRYARWMYKCKHPAFSYPH